MKKSETKKWLGLFLAFAVAVTTAFSPASFSYAAGEDGGSEGETPPVTVSGDVGQYATVSSSGTTGDRNLNSINDAKWEPVGNVGNESEYVPQNFGWGNWGMALPEEQYYYVQYDWMENITTSQIQLYWWDDNGGLGAPKDLRILYKGSDDTDWKEAEIATNFEDAKKLGQYNEVNFKQISAASIRLAMNKSDVSDQRPGINGIGICRWKVIGPPVSENQIYVSDENKLTLPARVKADFVLPAVTASGKALTWESSDTSVIGVEGNTAKVTLGRSEKTVKMTAKLNGKFFKEFFVAVERRALLQGATVELPFGNNAQGACWWNLNFLIDGDLNGVANGLNDVPEGRETVQLNFARKLSLTGTKVYWHTIFHGDVQYNELPQGVTFQYLRNEVSPDDAASWEDITLSDEPTFTEGIGGTGDTYTFNDTVNTTKLRMIINEGLLNGNKVTASITEWQVFGEEYVDQTDITAANAVKAKIEALGEAAYTEAFKAKLDEARAMYDALTDTQKGLLEDVYKTLTDAEDAYKNLAAAAAVVAAIGEILEVPGASVDGKLNVTEENKDQVQAKVTAARAAYDALNEAQQKLVTNYAVLTNAEAVLRDFGRPDEEILADLVVEINAIGSAEEMTVENMEQYKAKIESAEARRDALKDQTLVTGATGDTKAALDKLTALRAKYDSLKSSLETAQPVIDAINAIGTLAMTEECYARVQNALTKYNALTADAKALVTNYATLTAAQEYFEGKTIVTELSVSPTTKTLKVGDKFTMTATVAPSTAAVAWDSSDKTVATISATGEIEALKAGSTVITAKAGDNNKTASCTVKVEADTPGEITVTALTISETSKTLKVGDKFTLTATPTPSTAAVTWESSDKTVATVSAAGEVEALKEGSATITAKAGDKTAACAVKVEAASSGEITVTALTISDTSKTLKVGEKYTLTATPTPATATVTWESSDEAIAKVSETGEVEAIKEGQATITAKAGTKTAECMVTVEAAGSADVTVTKVTLNKGNFSLVIGKSFTLKATVEFSDGTTSNDVEWSVDKSGIVTLKNGIVTAKKKGTVKVTATSKDDSEQKATVTVTVKEVAIKKITLPKKLTMGNGDSITLKPTITPSNTTNKNVTWSVDKKGKNVVALKNGKVTANKKKTGTAKVTVTSKSNKKIKATITITVKKQPKSIKLGKIKGLKKNTVTLNKNKTCQIKVTMTPKNAGSLLTYKTSSKKIATVDANGKVKAIKKGTAKITITAGNKKKVVLTVKVK